jgi:hypothetical protein
MAIKNPDGSNYGVTGSLNQFDPESPSHDLFNRYDQEIIEIGGSPIFYYELFIQVHTMDKLYFEDRGKLWSPVPVELKAVYEPISSANDQGLFGIDSPAEMVFLMNFQGTLDRLGHMPKVGSRIFTPHKRENWEIIQRNSGDYQQYGEIRLELVCKRFQESLTTQEGKVTQAQPNYKVN